MEKPLAGVKVLDLTRVLAGPFCTMILQDLGAEVLKIEVPGTGDDSRSFGPFKDGRSLYFISINRGKRSMTLNLKDERGKAVLRKLLAAYDVVVENFRPGVMEKLGFGYETMSQEFPHIIYAASSGYGHSGPYSQRPAYDILAQAGGGLMSVTGWPDGPPTRVGVSIGDITASLFTAIGISSALYQRAQTGRGQKVDVAMLDCQVAILENALARFQVEGKSPEPLGNRHPTISPFQAYRCADEYIVIAIGNDQLWQRFCAAIGEDALAEDERFTTNRLRTENLAELNQILERVFTTRPADEWLTLLEDAGLPCSRINDMEKILDDPQVRARNMIVDVEDARAGVVRIAGNPIKMSTIPEEDKRPAVPELGEHTEGVLRALGYSTAEIRALREEGVI